MESNSLAPSRPTEAASKHRVASGLRVLVLSNRRIPGESIAAAIQQTVGLRVVAGSTDPPLGPKRLHRPDVVVVVGSRSDGSTSASIGMAKRRWPQSVVIALAETDRVEDGIALVRQGADTWLSRKDGLEALRAILDRISDGERMLLPLEILGQIANSLREVPTGRTESLSRLTSRETQVLACFAQGASRPDIAAMLGISPATLRTHVGNILRKLELHSIRHATALALREDLDSARRG